MLGEVYCIKNIVTDEKYIGITKKTFRVMYNYRDDWWNAPSVNIKLKNSVKKYGPNNFKVEILETCKIEILAEREIYYIALLNTLHPNGFNLTSGGNYNYCVSESSKLKNSLAHQNKIPWNKGKKLNKSHVEKSRKTRKAMYESGELVAWNKGKKLGKMSKESIEKSAKSHMKPVLCYKNDILIKKYDSIKETQIDGFNTSQVSLVCKNKAKSHRGYFFRYV